MRRYHHSAACPICNQTRIVPFPAGTTIHRFQRGPRAGMAIAICRRCIEPLITHLLLKNGFDPERQEYRGDLFPEEGGVVSQVEELTQ